MAAMSSSSIPLISKNKRMPTASNGSGPGAKDHFLLERIGGSASLKLAVDEFYALLMKDEMLCPFFEGVNIHKIKWHVYNFMSMILTWIPPEIDMSSYIGSRHARLFDEGLCEVHFDRFAKLFVESLRTVDGIATADVDEAANVLTSLRPIFVDGATAARERRETREAIQQRRDKLMRYGIPAVAAVAVIALASIVTIKKKK